MNYSKSRFLHRILVFLFTFGDSRWKWWGAEAALKQTVRERLVNLWYALPFPKRNYRGRSRLYLWPISVRLNRPWTIQLRRPIGSRWSVGWHCWHVCFETGVPYHLTSDGCMPGVRSWSGQTLHLGFFKLILGLRNG